jgi:hypothetical protein
MKTKSELLSDKANLQIEKMKMDRFFSMFLDKFGDKMDHEKPDTKIWQLYKSKLKEYDVINVKIRHLEYWISK